MRDLNQIQNWMQAAIMHPAGTLEGMASDEARCHIDVGQSGANAVVTGSNSMSALERLSIYSFAYFARLLECMREEFPVLTHALGEETFDAFAVGYLQAYPSRSYTLFQLADNFPRYLAETRPDPAEDGELLPGWPDFLIDLATLELTLSRVFDGPGVEGEALLDAEQLRKLSPESLLESRLVGVPCLQLLALKFPVHTYFTAVKQSHDPEFPEPAETWLAVTRRNFVVRHYELSRPAFELLQALLGGATFAEAIERAAESAGDDLDRFSNNLRAWFQDWAAEGFFLALAPS